jgi:hypothetical protein
MALNNPVEILNKGGLGSPQIGTTVLGNIPSIPIVSPRNYFLQQMESWISAPSHATQWIVLFDSFPKTLKTEVLQELEPVIKSDYGGWNIPYTQLTNYFLQKTIGCVFAQGFDLPRERADIEYGESKRGFRGSPYARNRSVHQNFQLDFLETNVSFVDGICRPWAALTSHKGLVARPEDESIKTNVTVIQYGRTNQYLSPIARKIWTFFDVACVGVQKTKYDYKNNDVEVRTGVEFVFSTYQIYNTTYIPVFTLIDKFSNGGVKELTDTIVLDKSIKNLGKLI